MFFLHRSAWVGEFKFPYWRVQTQRYCKARNIPCRLDKSVFYQSFSWSSKFSFPSVWRLRANLIVWLFCLLRVCSLSSSGALASLQPIRRCFHSYLCVYWFSSRYLLAFSCFCFCGCLCAEAHPDLWANHGKRFDSLTVQRYGYWVRSSWRAHPLHASCSPRYPGPLALHILSDSPSLP